MRRRKADSKPESQFHKDVNGRYMVALLVLIILLGAGIHIGVVELFDYFVHRRAPATDFSPWQQVFPARIRKPNLTDPAKAFPVYPLEIEKGSELDQLRAREDRFLNEYGWTDRANGIARIPVERAIEIMAEEER